MSGKEEGGRKEEGGECGKEEGGREEESQRDWWSLWTNLFIM